MKRSLSAFIVGLVLASAACVMPPQTAPPFEQPQPPLATLGVEVVDQAGTPKAGAAAKVHTQTETTGTNEAGYASWVLPTSAAGYGLSVSADGCQDAFQSVLPFLANQQVRIELVCAAAPGAPEMPITPPWSGQLRKARDDLGFQDAAGKWVLPVCAHFGEAFSAFTRRPTEVTAQLKVIKAAGYDCIREWDVLGYYDSNRPDQAAQWSAWKDKEVTPVAFVAYSGRSIPATPDYYSQRRAFTLAVKAAGLTLFHSRGDLNALTFSTVQSHTQQLANIYADPAVGWDVLALAESNNENFQNGSFTPEQLRRLVEPFKAHGALTAHSTADPAEEPDAIATISAGASIYTVHGLRTGEPTNILEHIFSLGYFQPRLTDFGPVPRLGIQGEPAGPGDGVSVGQVNDREQLAMMAATSLISRQWWVYMSGYGVFWKGPIESQPGFWAVPRIRQAIAEFAPDVMSWFLVHGGRAEAALKSPTGYIGAEGVTEGPARIFNAVRQDRRAVVAVVEGGKGAKRVQNVLDCALEVTVIGVNDDETLSRHTLTLQPRESFGVDYRIGRLLLGRCQ